MKKHEGLIVTKENDFHEWYNQLIIKGKLIHYYDVSGCYVLLPNSYAVWESIQKYLDAEFKLRGVKNAYFPLFITKENLNKESTHIEGFKPEVAWVTQAGDSKLEEPIAIRPTSECAIYPILPSLIKSYNDLPMKLNQWCSVVRWEFKDATPFIRSREFLWNEGHSCFNNTDNAMVEVNDIIKLYQKTYSDLLAVPTIIGKKTDKERFCGAVSTLTIETFIPFANKGVQAATAHCLGDNFSKIFNIIFNDTDMKNKHVIQNSWGFTTRSIGIMLMLHSDNKGVVFPPKVAPTQIVIVPIINKKSNDIVMDYATKIYENLKTSFRVEMDTRSHTPGWKYNYWEMNGTPIRIEVGPNDVKNSMVTVCRRDTGEKLEVRSENIEQMMDIILNKIHNNLYEVAYNKLMSSIEQPSSLDEMTKLFESQNKLCLMNWCGDLKCEEYFKDKYKAKSLCIPLELNLPFKKIDKCLICDNDGKELCLFGKSF
ncbi:MAG: prolyl-tRNA synthetase [Edafosvirus sp.]|uniref:Proline--tRNA ligase n=1 Tax=Edafosvirus sp. TaxID=2487765 RepID=A0A3G4ZT36_9VIRU|nr:MAG: prolyl-tRNA synthetase [Edafosvirus sp.]